MTKLSGLKGGIKQAENTRRLDDSISSSDFEKTRLKPTRISRQIRSIGEQGLYLVIICVLFCCAVRFTLQTYFPGRVHQLLAPILGKNSFVVEQTLTGTPTELKDEDIPDAEPPKSKQVVKKVTPTKKSSTTPKKSTRTRKHGHRRSRRHVLHH